MTIDEDSEDADRKTSEESSERELVLKLVLEGGLIQVFRQKTDGQQWTFHTRGSAMDLLGEEDDCPPRPSIPKPLPVFQTLNEAARYGLETWFSTTVWYVHPDLMDEVWNIREQAIADAEPQWRDHARERDHRWARLCKRELPDVSPRSSENLSDSMPHPTSVNSTPKVSDETKNSEPELLLELGVEGGGVKFFRHLENDGIWRFTFKGSNGGFDESEFIDDWVPPAPKEPEVFGLLDDAIASGGCDRQWVCFSPLRIHTDYRKHIWELRERIIESLEPREQNSARERDNRWAKICRRPVPN